MDHINTIDGNIRSIPTSILALWVTPIIRKKTTLHIQVANGVEVMKGEKGGVGTEPRERGGEGIARGVK